MPLISIAMAVYNGEPYLKQQIDSILAQTFSEFELVICDDCSTDNSWDVLKSYSRCDQRISIYKNNQNLGFCKNFERAISLCSADYIALSDQDDIWKENHLQLLYEGLGDKMMACGNALLVDSRGFSLNTTWKDYEQLNYIPDNDFLKLKSIVLFRNPYQGASMLFRRELLSFALPFPEGTHFHDRWLAMVACLTGGISYVDTIILHYRRMNTNVTAKRHKRNRVKALLHGWTMGSGTEIDQLLSIPNLIILDDLKKDMLKWRYVINNNTKWRKPITISHFLKDFKNIYSYSF